MTSELSPHVPADELADVALGEAPTPAMQAHLESCARCRLTVSELLEVIVTAQDGMPDGSLTVDPPARVWAAIDASIHEPTNVVPLTTPTRTTTGRPARRSRRRHTGPLLLAAAVVGILVGGGLVAATDAWRSEPTVVAAAPLAPVPGGPDGPQTGLAQIEKVSEGEVLSISTSDLADPTGYYEVWLLDPASGGMIAMGVVPPGSGTASLPVPPGVDLTTYAAVDISDEPMDGNPGHSAVSVLRGQLAT
ncbi:MAG: hypothetical protein QG597_1971 [Actinomycetota bacterium]|nr:hypothetical protein [Actinomycetota bacterium]